MTNEIGLLYQAFNTLMDDTQKLTNHLEDEVYKRTEDLHNKSYELQMSLNKLKDTQQQLIESEKMSALGSLVSGVAHEVNTPLGNAITGTTLISKEVYELSKLLRQNQLKKSTLEEKIHIIEQSTNLLLKTLQYASNLIKSFKQISVDQSIDDVRKINLSEYIEEVILTNYNRLKQIPVEVKFECEKDLELYTYPGFIAQIINNLISNSILHGFEDIEYKAIIQIEIQRVENKTIKIRYSDNGKGISEDVKTHIFEPFVTTKKNKGGTGLGMSITYNLITQKMNGRIKILDDIDGFGIEMILPHLDSLEDIL